MNNHINSAKIENTLLECRRLLTHCVTDRPEYSTMEKINADAPGFVRQCHTAYKRASELLIDQILKIETQINQIKTIKDNSLKNNISQLKYWQILLELSFNTFVWLAVGWDRSKVKKVFKGPKYGALAEQNINLLLDYVNQANQNPNDFVIPLDFCKFCCVGDLLRIRFQEPEAIFKINIFEAKSGRVNDEMLDAIQSGEQNQYFDFFEKYGSKGTKQMERYFRQTKVLVDNLNLMNAKSGIYNDPAKKDGKLIICENETIQKDFSNKINQLLESSEKKEFSVDEIDGCLVVGVINTTQPKFAALGDFDIRLFIYHLYINSDALDNPPNSDELVNILKMIKLSDWRKGFSSVILFPPLARPIADKYLIDLLMDRKRVMFFFNPNRFINLCNINGINASFTTQKEANRLKSRGEAKGLVEFDRKFIRWSSQEADLMFGEGTFGEMVYNWVRPISIVKQLEAFRLPSVENL
jgi:hypothetical protein